MKKTLLFVLCAAMLLSFAACGGPAKPDNTDDPPVSDDPATPDPEPSSTPDEGGNGGASDKAPGDMSLEEMFEVILDGVENLPSVQNITLDSETFANYLFIDPIEGAEALASEGMINAIAHSAVLLRLPDGADAEAVAKEIEANADPMKWVCVGAEKTIVSTHDNTILLVMSFADTADAIAANFDALWA